VSSQSHASTARPTLQKIFSQHRRTFEQEHGAGLSPQQWLALRKITACRTPVLGGNEHVCADCGCTHELYHSCNHRLCPQCGANEAHEWCEQKSADLLPGVDYFMVTPTLPGSLRAECRRSERQWYDWFFAATSNALMDMLADNKDGLGGQAGFFGVLQTWRRDLDYHPHIHYIVPGGVLIEERHKEPGQRKKSLHRRWKPCLTGSKGPYLVNAIALQTAVRKRMEQLVKEQAPALYARIPRNVWRQSWRIDIRHVGSGKEVTRYLARYVTKSAIANNQLQDCNNERVTHSYTPGGQKRSRRKTLPAHQFMKRVLQHALPEGFKRIRYFGWLHPSAKNRLEHVKLLVGKPLVYEQKSPAKESAPNKIKLQCKQCKGDRFEPPTKIAPLSTTRRTLWELTTFGAPPPPPKLTSISIRKNGSRAPPTNPAQATKVKAS